jgi:hypothetical protein
MKPPARVALERTDDYLLRHLHRVYSYDADSVEYPYSNERVERDVVGCKAEYSWRIQVDLLILLWLWLEKAGTPPRYDRWQEVHLFPPIASEFPVPIHTPTPWRVDSQSLW